ncbi:MAG: hypothetical protein KGJ40_05295 [candidate division NC10 bacterium]|nr:hypothetical protein [candidate division NC10 bacterium]MDE2484674.1 hypothetical protein [candidate division NC10 bacterium]
MKGFPATGTWSTLWLAAVASALLVGQCLVPPLAKGEEQKIRVQDHRPPP